MIELKYTYEQTLLYSKLEIQEETLRTISQEIQNNIGQVLSLIKLQLNTLPVSEKEENIEAISFTKDLAGQAINDLRRLSRSLFPDRVTELGLEESIRQELEIVEKKKHPLETKLSIKNSPYKISAQAQTILFRMVQEAVSNIIKHASASKVEVIIDYDPLCFSLLVQDNGIGITAKTNVDFNSEGEGLKTMQSRSAVIGASFNLEETAGGGTTVKISVPGAGLEVTENI
jgi:signal transduction histidine kinase